MVDLRNVYRRHEVEAAGLYYYSVGRPNSAGLPTIEVEAAE